MLRSLLDAVRRRFSRAEEAPSGESVRSAFQERYHQFKLLLNANN
jgi:hypothetical protein